MQPITADTWRALLSHVFGLFDDLERRGFGTPPFVLGGGTVLMLRFRHRLSKDIDLFGYDAQWLPLLTPRLNEKAAALAQDYVEQANTIKIVTGIGDIDFVVAADLLPDVARPLLTVNGRTIPLDATAEVLAKKMFYRTATFTPRDVYDMSAAIDLDPDAASTACFTIRSKGDLLLRRLDAMGEQDADTLIRQLVPYEGKLAHAAGMVAKVRAFIAQEAAA